MAALCGAMQPNVCVMDESASASARPAWNDGSGEVYLHPSSSLHPLTASKLLSPYLLYSEKVRSVQCYLCISQAYLLYSETACMGPAHASVETQQHQGQHFMNSP